MEKETAFLEAILYLEADPMDKGSLCRVSGLSKETVDAALAELEAKYGREDSGLELSRIGGGIMISPKKEYWEQLKERYGKRNESRLSRAAMETLTIVAYKQPVTRAEIKAMRGVESDNMVHMLVEKDLVREVGKKDIPGKPVQYGTTREFLKLFRLNSIAELPKLGESEADRFELDGER
ncbi:MAG: SMC-Scp complex subunit ScpB [Treponema sp.]|jgi:segregation and condensation protein B|nr:SMC-Scp complex subunit ScpB [Treponema sp.]